VPRIRVLPDELVNRIAAGEVVERPASVVKELVENSLDAGSTRISIELANGGRTLIRVVDNGCGMDADDALLALERHATSKIAAPEELDRITTLGFRGEALPSLAAVSRFTLHTAADPSLGGVRVEMDGGRILAVEGVARARGTTVEVRDLFFNVPARRKFLHAPETELRHCQEAVWGAALGRPDVAFSLSHGPRRLIEVPVAADIEARLGELLKRRQAGTTKRFEASGAGITVRGLLVTGGSGARHVLHLLVNGRPVRDRLLVGAVLRTLRAGGPGLRGARVVLMVELPPEAVDVNVHPAKAEVRFARPGSVVALVERGLRSGVVASQGEVEVRSLGQVEGPGRVAAPAPGAYGGARPDRSGPSLFTHPAYDSSASAEESMGDRPRPPHVSAAPRRAVVADTPFGRLIGQYRESFLLVEDDQGLMVVDQHVAHERVLFDQIRRRLSGETAPSQGLLEPLLVEVEEALLAALPRVEELLARAGIEAEIFGSDTLRLAALPPDLPAEEAHELVIELLERAASLDGDPAQVTERLTEELAASLSCRAAIKVNHRLTVEAQRALLADLATTDNPYRCPHGRPIVLRLSQEEMERRLGRR
jgi:DNA mismatch repair protein MutL